MSRENPAAVKEFALKCRKVRLWLAAHPGSTSYEMRSALGGGVDMALSKMLGMRIVCCQNSGEKGARAFKWFVVPQ